jgi:thiamine transporter
MSGLFNTKTLVTCAICISIAFVLKLIPAVSMPYGGSITFCSMLFIVLAAYWYGPVVGIVTGLTLGLLNLLTGAYILHPAQVLLDYPLPFALLGLAGFFRKMKYGLAVGYLVGVLGRFSMHFLSGIIFWGMYAPAGQPVAVYSAIYNGSYIWPEAIITLFIINIPAFKKAIDRVGGMAGAPSGV